VQPETKSSAAAPKIFFRLGIVLLPVFNEVQRLIGRWVLSSAGCAGTSCPTGPTAPACTRNPRAGGERLASIAPPILDDEAGGQVRLEEESVIRRLDRGAFGKMPDHFNERIRARPVFDDVGRSRAGTAVNRNA